MKGLNVRVRGQKEDTEMEIEIDGEGRGGLRQVTRQGNDLCMYGAQKTNCISNQDEDKLQQLPEIAVGKKGSKNSIHS